MASNDARLEKLCLLPQRQFGDREAEQLCKALQQNTVLKELAITSHAVSPAAAAAFAEVLAASNCLASLSLGNRSFGDEVGAPPGAGSLLAVHMPHMPEACGGAREQGGASSLVQGLAALCPGIEKSSSLRQLNLDAKARRAGAEAVGVVQRPGGRGASLFFLVVRIPC